MKEYCIPYKGLKNGVHNFDFSVNSLFFKNFESSKIKMGEFEIKLNLDKKEGWIVLGFYIEGWYKAKCDRCLTTLQIPLDVEEQIIVKFDEEEGWEDDVMYINPNSHQIDLSEAIYEMIHVNMPLMNVINCENEQWKKCDKKILNKLNNKPNSDVETQSVRWNTLKKFKFK